MRKFIPVISMGLISILVLTSCVPSGNVVGSADVTVTESPFGTPTLNGKVSVNGGIIATPKGLRARLNKFTFSIPSQGIIFSANKFNDVVSTDFIPQSKFIADAIKGRNTCATVSGFLQNGGPFTTAFLSDTKSDQHLFVFISYDYFYIGITSNENLNIGGRNLCGNWSL